MEVKFVSDDVTLTSLPAGNINGGRTIRMTPVIRMTPKVTFQIFIGVLRMMKAKIIVNRGIVKNKVMASPSGSNCSDE